MVLDLLLQQRELCVGGIILAQDKLVVDKEPDEVEVKAAH